MGYILTGADIEDDKYTLQGFVGKETKVVTKKELIALSEECEVFGFDGAEVLTTYASVKEFLETLNLQLQLTGHPLDECLTIDDETGEVKLKNLTTSAVESLMKNDSILTVPSYVTHFDMTFPEELRCYKISQVDFPEGVKVITREGKVSPVIHAKVLRLPTTLTIMGKHAFSCVSRRSADTEFNSFDSVVMHCPKLRKISDNAFAECVIGSLDLNAPIKTIGSKAFRDATLPEVLQLPVQLQVIHDYAFSGCNTLRQVTFGENLNKVGAFAFEKTGLTFVTLPKGVSFSENCFACCDSLESVVLAEGVTALPLHMFMGCSALTSVVRSEQLAGVPAKCFSDCSSLQEFAFGKIWKIGEDAFRHTGLKKADVTFKKHADVLPPQIAKHAFSECFALTHVSFNGPLEKLPSNLFSDCCSLFSVDLTETLITKVTDKTLLGCPKLREIRLPFAGFHSESLLSLLLGLGHDIDTLWLPEILENPAILKHIPCSTFIAYRGTYMAEWCEKHKVRCKLVDRGR